jgi:hypothetical protein
MPFLDVRRRCVGGSGRRRANGALRKHKNGNTRSCLLSAFCISVLVFSHGGRDAATDVDL